MLHKHCPNAEQLTDYSLGRLDDASCEYLDNHLSSCAACQTILTSSNPLADTLVSQLRQGVRAGQFDREPELLEAIERLNELISCDQTLVGEYSVVVRCDDSVERIGPYRILSVLGKGGMGQVYLAEHSRLEMTVAVKVLADHLTGNSNAINRFDREMKAVGRLSHPNIVRATDAGEHDGKHYLAMEFVDGHDLSQILRACGRLRIGDACEAVRQAAVGIQHAHENGLIHRDLKPSNLMVTKKGQIKILDLGLARLHSSDTEGLTSDFQIMGTADYMAPEQALKALQVDSRVDVYSLGCTLYALLCGMPPFAGAKYETSISKIMAHEHEQPVPLFLRRTDVPAELSAIVDRAMAKSPADRFATADDLATALLPFSRDSALASLVTSVTASQSLPGDTSDIGRHSLATVTMASPLPTKPTIPAGPGKRVWVGLGLMLVGLMAAAAFVLHFSSGKGAIVVEIHGDQISAQIEGERLVIQDIAKENTYYLSIEGDTSLQPLASGEYTIQVENEATGLRLETEEFTISRNSETVVRAFIQPPTVVEPSMPAVVEPSQPVEPIAATERALAEWAIHNGAILDISFDNQGAFVSTLDELPPVEFRVVTINFTPQLGLTDGDWNRLRQFQWLGRLEFQDPKDLVRLVSGVEGIESVTNLKLRYDQTQPEQLQQLGRLTRVQDFDIGGQLVGDSEAEMLRGLKKVFRLTFSGRQATDASLVPLSQMRQLTFLSLIFTKVTGSGLVHLENLPHLDSLHLPYTPIDDAGLTDIAKLRELIWLNLGFTQIGDEGLIPISGLTKLDNLDLAETRVTDRGLAALSSIASLRTLNLDGTRITDAAVDQLAKFTQLTTLSLGNRLSADALEQLGTQLPNCQINSIPRDD
ncbi:serine/threonine-protein kinase [Neorhodopirellula pilleata]|uniref:Serine/threonine-protein kinase PknB n=1 Tax=Neorhodopirellula pilleata TaxID=2714738 RepID=A0A5C6AUA1_9BACT|nr:serine/threonine-protein kinase [Neorhodopirellula pilleata]TWU03168.1 Serine/threonine-protein kinase PknB [Neorhodopirellula pilleata]